MGFKVSPIFILAFGLAKFFCGAVSSGIKEWLLIDAGVENAQHEKLLQEKELRDYPEDKIQEMIEFYSAKGMTEEDAEEFVNTLSNNEFSFSELVLSEKYGIPNDFHTESPWKLAYVRGF